MRFIVPALIAVMAIGALSIPATADEPIVLTIKDHKFQPEELRIPAGKRVVITFINNDPTPEEFDSSALKVEKVVAGNSKGTIRIGPLTPGRYEFMGEYHADTAKGVVVVE
jgi:plastocyanin